MFIFPEEIRKAYEAIPIPLVFYQFIDGKVVPLLVSDGFCRLVELDREETMKWLVGGQFERIHPDDAGNVAHVSDDFAHHRSEYNVFFRARHTDGYHYIHAVGEWMIMPDGTELAMLTYLDISHSSKAVSILTEKYNLFRQDEFYSDPVTGLPNINYLVKFGDERVHALRSAGKLPALIYFDVNSMQSYNNQYGFKKGDDLIRLIATVLQETFPDALIVRGVEDHILLIMDPESRAQLCEKIEQANRRIRKEAYGNTTGVVAGICEMTGDMRCAEAMDHTRHAVRQIGSDLNTVWRFWSLDTDEQYWNQLYIVENHEQALNNNWFRVYYQGIAETKTGNGAALEALARWVDPIRGIISPADFIPSMQKYHLLYKLDLYIFEQVCREISIRHENGLSLLPVSVNFARQDFAHVDMVAELNRIADSYDIGRYGIGKNYFIIEITEQDMATAPEQFYKQLAALRSYGFRVWLDDFGSAYSSLNLFSKIDVDLIKFDMDLVRNLDRKNNANREILQAITEICRKRGIHTLAEGVETEEQRDFLIRIGCELSQGYLYHRPEPLEQILYKRKYGYRQRKMVTDERLKQLI